jgi:dethiobiotin synthetase
MTINACKSYGLRVAGLVVNMMSKSPGKVEKSIPRTLTELTGVPVLAIIPRLRTPTFIAAGEAIEKTMDLDSLLAME